MRFLRRFLMLPANFLEPSPHSTGVIPNPRDLCGCEESAFSSASPFVLRRTCGEGELS